MNKLNRDNPDDYKKSTARSKGRLVLKNDTNYKKKKKKEKRRLEKALGKSSKNSESVRDDCAIDKIEYKESSEFKEDRRMHHGWWKINDALQLREACAFEFEVEDQEIIFKTDLFEQGMVRVIFETDLLGG